MARNRAITEMTTAQYRVKVQVSAFSTLVNVGEIISRESCFRAALPAKGDEWGSQSGTLSCELA